MPKLSVVMPYYKNERTLWRCLSALVAQKCAALSEIVVVDDGGAVRAADVVANRELGVPLRILTTPNLGQSGATNAGLRASSADIAVLTCADIIAAPNFLQAHLEVHASWHEPVVVCGHIAYAPWLRMTPFMRYLEEPNVQFDFTHIETPDSIGPGMFYAPNVSARLVDLERAGLFDEQLVYGFQDIDLGIKLAQLGIRLVYCAKARALHDHPNSPDQFFSRQVRVGHMLPRFLHNHPDNALGRRFVDTLDKSLPVLAQADALLHQMRSIEQRASTMPQHFAALRTDLFHFYHVVMTLGFVKGALETGETLRQLLNISSERWQHYRSEARRFALDARGVAVANAMRGAMQAPASGP